MEQIKRFQPSLDGLTEEQVSIREKQGLVNYDTAVPTKSIRQIVLSNIFTLFNLLNFVLALLVFSVGSYKNLLFMGVVVCNTVISIIQEINAKKTIDKLSIISMSKIKVIRNGELKEIGVNDIVLDDVLELSLGNQVVTDVTILEGACEVDESFITGESQTISKKKGDFILSGSFIVSGKVRAKVEHIGLENYTARISSEARYFKKVNSILMKSLNQIIKAVSILILPIGILLFVRQLGIGGNDYAGAVVNTVAAILGMIPEGLVLLTSTVLAVSVVRLSKYNVLVQNLYCIETLSRVDTLCLDKTGTITEGKMEVYATIPYQNFKMEEINQALALLTHYLEDHNATMEALRNKYKKDVQEEVKEIFPFSSEKKYSGISLRGKGAYFIGAPEYLLKEKYKFFEEELQEYMQENRVLLLVHCKENKLDTSNIELMALILLRDKIRKEAVATLKYFKDQDVTIKVISGDHVKTVSNIAKRAGIKDYQKCVDMSRIMTPEELKKVASTYTIFGRVSPIQKKELILAMKEAGHTVAMTGDGVNDVLALKEADCSIAMASGMDAARNVAELVLLDSNFDSMPKVVAEGRRTINNIERSATLFLTKTMYATTLAIVFIFLNREYPFVPIQLTLTSVCTIGIPSFFLAIQPNKNRIGGNFIKNVLSKAFPSAMTIVINIIMIMMISSVFHFTPEQTSTLCVAMNAFVGFRLLYQLCLPFNLFKRILFGSMILLLVLQAIFLRSFYSLTVLNIPMMITVGVLVCFSLMMFQMITKLFEKYISPKLNFTKK